MKIKNNQYVYIYIYIYIFIVFYFHIFIVYLYISQPHGLDRVEVSVVNPVAFTTLSSTLSSVKGQ